MPSSTQPPPKPPRRPPQLPQDAPRITQDLVRPIPGIPVTRAKPDPATVAAARAAARQSSPDLIEHRLTELEKDLSQYAVRHDKAVQEIKAGMGAITERFDEFERSNSVSEVTKIQEEQKTKRFTALVGVLTLVLTPLITVVTNQLTKTDQPPAVTTPRFQRSANDIAIAACKREFKTDTKAQAKCITDIAIANISPVEH